MVTIMTKPKNQRSNKVSSSASSADMRDTKKAKTTETEVDPSCVLDHPTFCNHQRKFQYSWYCRENELESSTKATFFHDYLEDHTTLVVGDGDFSFSVSLMNHIETMKKGRFVTSVFQKNKEELISMYHPHNSKAKEHLKYMVQSKKIHHYFGVDATDLNNTTVDFCEKGGADTLFDRVVFCYPFPNSNGDIKERTALIDKFFRSVRCWTSFDPQNGQIILGLKSTATKEDFQLDFWNVEKIAKANGYRRVATSAAMVTFWRATHVNGRPLNRVKEIFDDRSVLVKFYCFQLLDSSQK